MEGPHEVLDPDGDVIITLRNPGATFAEAAAEAEPEDVFSEWHSIEKPPIIRKGKKAKKGTVMIRNPEAPKAALFIATEEPAIEQAPAPVAEAAGAVSVAEVKPADPNGLLDGNDSREAGENRPQPEPTEIHMRVSSRHLILASPYFKVALNSRWEEAAPASTKCSARIYAHDWDLEAFLILMRIIHGRNRQVPRHVSLELLAKIAVLVDYYDCHEAVEVFVELWLQQLRSQLPTQANRELILGFCVSWVFRDADVFASVTSTALQQSRGPLQTLGLPIPKGIVEAIDTQRQEVVGKIISALHELCTTLRDGPDKCSFECASIQLGALMKQMRTKRFDPKPETPLLGYSVKASMDAARSIRAPVWGHVGFLGFPSQSCSLVSLIGSKMEGLEEKMTGLTLDQF